MTVSWHASKYKVREFHQKYILNLKITTSGFAGLREHTVKDRTAKAYVAVRSVILSHGEAMFNSSTTNRSVREADEMY